MKNMTSQCGFYYHYYYYCVTAGKSFFKIFFCLYQMETVETEQLRNDMKQLRSELHESSHHKSFIATICLKSLQKEVQPFTSCFVVDVDFFVQFSFLEEMSVQDAIYFPKVLTTLVTGEKYNMKMFQLLKCHQWGFFNSFTRSSICFLHYTLFLIST